MEWRVWEIAEGADIDLQEDSMSVFITVPRTAPALPQDLLMNKHRSRFSFSFSLIFNFILEYVVVSPVYLFHSRMKCRKEKPHSIYKN